MQMIFNISQKFIIIKDMTDVIDFGPINQEFDKLDFKDNISNHVSNVYIDKRTMLVTYFDDRCHELHLLNCLV